MALPLWPIDKQRFAGIMVVRFTWRAKEWREAYLLSTAGHDRGGGPVPMGYLILAITAAGGLGDLQRSLNRHRDAVLSDSLLPMLVLVVALALAAIAGFAVLRHRHRYRGLPAIPQGEQQVTLHELGWGISTDQDASAKPHVRDWAEFRGQRLSRGVLALLTRDGTTVSLPLRALTEDQGGWLERLLTRKIPRIA